MDLPQIARMTQMNRERKIPKDFQSHCLIGAAILSLALALPEGVALAIHNPADRKQLAYLASTSEGRRVYLNRLLTDADVVVPVGRLGYDAVLGYRGPWGLIFPGLSDQETARSFRALTTAEWPRRDRPRPALTESRCALR